jgi:hypothetical protein
VSNEVIRETHITFDRERDVVSIYTTYPYIAKQLDKLEDAVLVQSTQDPQGRFDDSWEYELPLDYFYYKGRLRIPRRLDK